MVQYYTLEEAAQLLHVPVELLKEMVKRNEVRAFQDRGTLRFRKQEVDELARVRGLGSDPDLPLGEKPRSSGGSPSSSARRRAQAAAEAASFPLEEAPPPGAPKSAPPSSGSKRKTSAPKTPGPRSPFPKGASDSDVRLVSDSSDLDFHLEAEDHAAKSKAPGAPKSSPKRPSKIPPPAVAETHVPMLPQGPAGDSDVKLEGEADDEGVVRLGQQGAKAPSDSDIRLEGDPTVGTGGRRHEGLITEEIDLDAEAAKLEEVKRKKKEGSTDKNKPVAPPAPPLPTSSPFELSENDINVGAAPPSGKKKKDSTGDFELTAPDESSPIELPSDEVPKLKDGSSEEEVTLGELTGGAGASGIGIQEPVDSGISLEGSEDEIEFDLSLDAGAGATPGPTTPKEGQTSSSEFELSLPDEEGLSHKASDSDSEFELTLDEEGSSEVELEGSPPESTSDSEFELTLDEEGGLTALDETAAASGEEGKDIFETDFDVPALDEESGSEAVPLEGTTDLEESEFELDVEGGETTDEETGEDFALEREGSEFDEEDEPAPAPKRKTTARGKRAAVAEDEEGLDLSLETEEEEEAEEEEEPAAVAAAPAAPAEWGPLPALVLLPCVILLIVIGLMGFELIQGSWGFHKPAKVTSLVVDPIARMFDDTLPKE
jgi:excisionase family DNA binding protein